MPRPRFQTLRQGSLGRSVASAVAVVVGALTLLSPAPALADDLGVATLFNQSYRVRRFYYGSQIIFPDALNANRNVRLSSVTAAHSLGPDRLLIATNTAYFAPTVSYKNYILEIAVDNDVNHDPTGIRYVRTVLHNDVSVDGYDLDPRGLTINTSEHGLGANGNLVVASAGNTLRHFDLDTGEPLNWGAGFNGYTIGNPNTSTEDVAFVPTRNMFFTAWRSPASALTLFTRGGRTGPAFYVGRNRYPGTAGMPCGLAYLDGSSTFPRVFDYRPGVLVSTDDNEPALEYYDVDSRIIARQRVSSTLAPGAVTLPLHGSSAQLFLGGIAAEPSSGRLFLFNRGLTNGAMDVFVLTPIPVPCPADFNVDGFLDFFDYDEFMGAFESGDPRADFNGDAFLDFFDVDGFSQAYEVGC